MSVIQLQLLFLLISLFLLPRPAAPLSFSYTRFTGVRSASRCPAGAGRICLDGDASLGRDSVIQLTNDQLASVGWAFYSEPLLLRSNDSSSPPTSFTTRFSFNISKLAASATEQADGMAFFLLPYPFVRPPRSAGGFLGLVTNNNADDPTLPGDNRFVAVEIDTYWNYQWDPFQVPHIGIDVNSIRSVATQGLIPPGGPHLLGEARVDYNGAAKKLSVSVAYDGNHTKLSQSVDLGSILPASAVVGISGATGTLSEFNQLISWSFKSSSGPA